MLWRKLLCCHGNQNIFTGGQFGYLLLQVTFSQSFPIYYIRIMQRTANYEQFKDLRLVYDDTTTQIVSDETFHCDILVNEFLPWGRILYILK